MNAKLRFVGNLLFILLSLSVLFSYAMFQGGFVSWFLFYGFLPILIYHFILLFLPMKKWKVRRDLDRRFLRAGESTNARVTLERNTRFPLYYVVIEELLPATLNRKHRTFQQLTYLNEPEKATGKRTVKGMVPIGFRKVIEFPYHLEELPRGQHELRAIRVLISDVFGFVKKEHIFSVEDEVIVQPNEWEIRLLDGAVSFEQGQTVVNSFQLQQTNIATGAREYAPGDRLSWIDWKQTAKKQTVMTKEFEQERSNHLLLVLDACRPKKLNPLAFEAGIELASSLLGKFINTTTDVDFLTIGSEVRNFSMKASRRFHEEAKHHLTRIQPDSEKSFSHLLEETLKRHMKLDCMVIITTAIDESFRDTIQALRIRVSHLVILYIQGSEFMTMKEKEWMDEMKRDGTKLRVVTEKELHTIPLEVNIR